MKTNNQSNSFLYQQATLQKGQLDERDLIEQGRRLVFTDKKIKYFIKSFAYWLEQTFVQWGWKAAQDPKENYFAKKSLKAIRAMNEDQLIATFKNVSQEERTHYLSLLNRGDILVSNSSHWHQIRSLHRAHAFTEETKANFQTHWLKSFMSETDLNQLNPLQSNEQKQQVIYLIELHTLQVESENPDFVPLLKHLLNGTSLTQLTSQQVQNLKICLGLYQDLSNQTSEGRLEKTLKLFSILKGIEKEDSGLQKRIDFYNFLQKHVSVQNLLLRIPRGSNIDLLQLPALVNQLSTLPADFSLSQTVEESLQKLQDALPENKSRLLAKRWGPAFARALTAIQDQSSLEEPLQKLQKIEEDFRLCGKTERFVQLLQEAVGTESFKNRRELEKVIEKFQSQDPLLIHLMTRISIQTRIYLQQGVDAKRVQTFQKNLIDALAPTTTELVTRYVDGEEGINKKIQEATKKFHLEQLQEAKQQWAVYGEAFVEQVLHALGPQVTSGAIHYKQNSHLMPDLTERDRLFVQLGVNQVRAEYGTAFATHAVHYLLSPSGKKYLEAHSTYIQTEWPALIQQLAKVKEQFQKQGVSGAQFEQALQRFLTESPYALFHDKEFLFDTAVLEEFSCFFQKQLNDQKLSTFAQSHGVFFQKVLKDYLREHETDVLIGKQAFEDAMFNQVTPFSEQVRLFLLPYIFEDLSPLEVLDEKIITSVLLKEPLTAANFAARIHHLKELKKFAELAEKPREKTFIKELIRHTQAYGVHNAPLSDKDKKIIQNTFLKFMKFGCREVDQTGIYTPDLLVKALLELTRTEQASNASLEHLQQIAEKCDEFFNSKIKDKFKAICVQLYLKDIAQQTCVKLGKVNNEKIQKLIEGLQSRFTSLEEGLTSPHARAYVQEIISFAVQLSLEHPIDYFTVIDFFSQEITNKTISFDLKKINRSTTPALPPHLKDKMISQAQKLRQVTQAEETSFLSILKRNPFAPVEAFAPRFIENLLADQDKSQVEDIRKALMPLGPLVNQSANVNMAIEKLSLVMALIPEADKTASVKETIHKQILILNNLKLDAMEKAFQPHEYKEAISAQGLGLLAIGIRFVSNQLVEAYDDMHHNPQSNDPIVSFMSHTLPKLVEDRETITNWIGRLAYLIPVIRRMGGGWIAHQILKRYLASKLDSVDTLDAHSKKIIMASLESIIKTVLLAVPALVKHHDINRYLEFFEKLHTLMQQKEPPEEGVIFMELLRMIQQLTQEVTAYGPLVEEAINHAEKTLQLS